MPTTHFDNNSDPLVQTYPVHEHEHIISCLVENHSGVLAHISGMFATRGFNIKSLAVGETPDPTVSRITIVVWGDDRVIDQIIKQLNKLVDVIETVDMMEKPHVERELMFIKVKANAQTRSELMQLTDIFRASIIDVHADCLVIQISGKVDQNEALLGLLEPFGIIEMARTGRIAMRRGPDHLSVPELTAEGTHA